MGRTHVARNTLNPEWRTAVPLHTLRTQQRTENVVRVEVWAVRDDDGASSSPPSCPLDSSQLRSG